MTQLSFVNFTLFKMLPVQFRVVKALCSGTLVGGGAECNDVQPSKKDKFLAK